MRYLFGFLSVCALGVMPLVGCSETGGSLVCDFDSDCNDDNDCTEDVCDFADGVCSNTNEPKDTPCGEGGVCDGAGTCIECNTDEQCNDFNDCTEEQCDPANGECTVTPLADGTTCAGGVCQSGVCALSSTLLPCTEQGIRNAIAAGGDAPYTFDCDGPQTVFTVAEILIANDVILDGEGKLTVDGKEDHRIFLVPDGVTVELHGFTVVNGAVLGEDGGGIVNKGTLTLIDSVVSNNHSGATYDSGTGGTGGATSYGGSAGGIQNTGQMTIIDSTVSGNTAELGSGGIENTGDMAILDSSVEGNHNGYGVSAGGGISNGGTLTLTNSTVSGNTTSSAGGGISNGGTLTLTNSAISGNTAGSSGGGISNGGTLTLTNSTISGNTASSGGGGISNGGTLTLTNSTVSGNTTSSAGGGIGNGGTLTLTNSTISGNTAYVSGGIGNRGTLMLRNSTVSHNTAESSGGGISNGGTLTLTNSTVSGNTASEQGSAIYAEDGRDVASRVETALTLIDGGCASLGDDAIWVSDGYNIESPGNTCGFDQSTDLTEQTVEELNLGPLQDNGGPTMTHALLTDPVVSAAIDKISAEDCVDSDGLPLTTDQRGLPRPVGNRCDVGAYEVQP